MLKAAIIGVLVLIVTLYFFRCHEKAPLPKLTNQYWGPGEPREDDTSIRSFKIDVSEEIINDLKTRLNATRSLRQPLEGASWTYGISSDYLRTVLEYWRTKYDWKKRQALLNKYPQFKTRIQGLDIHFYHIKPTVPKDVNVRILPLLLLHGWPGSIVEFQKIIPLLITPQFGKDFVFELVVPSLPGFGFSDASVRPGLGSPQIAVIMKNLMLRLGFKKFYLQGGDAGSVANGNLAILYPENVLGIHDNLCTTSLGKNVFWVLLGSYFPSVVVSAEYQSRMYPLTHHLSRFIEEMGYMHIQATKPDTVGTALSDSPAGLAAYILEKFSTWTNAEYRFREDGGLLEKYTMDELLDNVMVYWVTNSITTTMRLYAERFSKANTALGLNDAQVLPLAACASSPHEISYRPESLLRIRYPNLIQMSHLPRGGHFLAMEEPQLLADDFWNFVSLTEKRLKADAKTAGKEL